MTPLQWDIRKGSKALKPDTKARFGGCMATFIYKAIEKHFENLFCHYAPLRKALQRAKKTESRLK